MKIFWLLVTILLVCLLQKGVSSKKKSIKKKALDFNLNYSNFPFILFKSVHILEDVYGIWNYLLKHPNEDIRSSLFNRKEHEIIGKFLEVSSKLKDLGAEVQNVADATVTSILQAFPKILLLELNMHELTLIINQEPSASGQLRDEYQGFYVNFLNDQMYKFLVMGYKNGMTSKKSMAVSMDFFNDLNQNRSHLHNATFGKEMSNSIQKRNTDENVEELSLERFTFENFAIWATSYSYNSLQSLLHRINTLSVPDESRSLFDLFNEISREMKTNQCNLRQSPHQTLYNLYNTIAVAELKGNVLLQFSYMLLKLYNKGNFTREAETAQSNYEKNTKLKLEAIHRALSKADRSIYKCDPNQFVEGVTFAKLTKLLQGYIENEVNLNPYGTCRENCQFYTYTEYNTCYKNQFCAQQPPCKGKVIECRYVDSDMNICTSSNPDRRYEWVEYENGKVLGNMGVCQKKNLFKVDSWWRYLFWHCSYCLCLCDDAHHGSDRYFNLRDVTSDIKNNKIVTGLRIVKENQIVHLQIQEGVLNPLGVVNKTSLSWKSVDDYSIEDSNVKNNVDYHTMSWLERTIDMDEVYGPPEHVVTGVRFRKIGSHLNLEVRLTPINFTTGEVFDVTHSYWLGNDNTEVSTKNPRTEIILENPDIPIRNGPHLVNSKHNQYVKFQPTSFETDAGQSTVPFLDSQVITSQGFPLSGIGLIHRGKYGSGGFIAPKLISYDFTPHLSFN